MFDITERRLVENRIIRFMIKGFCKTFWLIKNCFTMKCEWIIFKGLLRLYDHISTVCEPNFQNEALLKLQVQHFESSKWCWILNATCTMHIHIIVVFFKSYEMDPLLREKYPLFAMDWNFRSTGQLFKRGTSGWSLRPKSTERKGNFFLKNGSIS